MKKCFAILLIVLIILPVLSLNGCHKPVTNQGEIVGDLQKSAVTMPPPKGIVLIPAGEFQIGSRYADNELPVRTVYVDAFYMDKTEVTNAQYKAFLIANPYWQKSHIQARFHSGYYLQQASLPDGYYFQQVREPVPPDPDYLHDWNGINYPTGKANHPVTFVSWYATRAYAAWAGKRLPTEAEWERAARGSLVGKKYPNGNTITVRDANYMGAKYGENVEDTTAVGRYPANGYGLYDMAGNVYEWCLDEYKRRFYFTLPWKGVARNPLSGANSVKWILDNFTKIKLPRVLRGGSWHFSGVSVRVANRYVKLPTFTLNTGFRGVRSVTDE